MQYLPLNEKNPYEVPTSLYLPAIAIISNSDELDRSQWDINNADNFRWNFFQYNAEKTGSEILEYIAAISCLDWLEQSTELSEFEK